MILRDQSGDDRLRHTGMSGKPVARPAGGKYLLEHDTPGGMDLL